MSPAALVQAEQQAHARLRAEATEEAHHAWLEARHAILDHVQQHGRIDDLDSLTTYRINRRGSLAKGPLCQRRFLQWSMHGASSCSSGS